MKLKSIALEQVQIKDPFWSKHVDLVRKEIIPYQWNAMNDAISDADPSHCLDNFRIAAGLKKGNFYGEPFQDTDIAKWLEAVGFSLSCFKDEELERTADEVIDLIGSVQQPDGYFNTYFLVKSPEQRWKNLSEGHELYTAGHMMEAAVAYYNGTGKRKFLDIVLKLADLICDTFGDEKGKIPGYPGHPEVEVGLFKLYEVTGEKKYLEMARYFVDKRGVGDNYFVKEMQREDYKRIYPDFHDYDPSYSQSHKPVTEQDKADGHAVRAVYLYSAMADLAEAYQDEKLLQACKRLWDNIVTKRMYITGGIGSSGIMERFTTDYDLPNDHGYCESCASIGLAMFGLRMAKITQDASYMDVVERALYNTVLAGIALDGKSFFYVNPLEVWPQNCINRTSKEHVKPIRQKWFGVACCPPNIARTLASLGQYIYTASDSKLYINLFISNEVQLELDGKPTNIVIDTQFPYENKIHIRVKQASASGLSLAIRIPDYALDYQIHTANGNVDYVRDKNYANITVKSGETITVEFKAPPRFVYANPKVRVDTGKVALMKGPLVYCLEEIDNGENLAALFVRTDSQIEEVKSDILANTTILTLDGYRMEETEWGENELYGLHPAKFRDVKLMAVPYAYWNNRGMGEMQVWIKELY